MREKISYCFWRVVLFVVRPAARMASAMGLLWRRRGRILRILTAVEELSLVIDDEPRESFEEIHDANHRVFTAMNGVIFAMDPNDRIVRVIEGKVE